MLEHETDNGTKAVAPTKGDRVQLQPGTARLQEVSW